MGINNNNNEDSNLSPRRCSIHPSGTFVTGCIDLMVGKDRDGILLRLFYPTSLTNVLEHQSQWTNWYLGTQYSKGFSKFFMPCGLTNPISQLCTDYYTKKAKIPAVWGAPVADGCFPVIIFSHGLAANRSVYSSVCNNIASHGFIVAALEHRDKSASATFMLNESGKKKWMLLKTPMFQKGEFDLRFEQVKHRSRECIKTLDVLEQLNHGKLLTNDLPSKFELIAFRGKIDTCHALVAGHSFGGATAILVLSKDKRFKGGICLDPWMYPLDAFHQSRMVYLESERNEIASLSETVKQPLLFVLMERFQSKDNLEAMKKYQNKNNKFWTLLKGDHNDQTDVGLLFKDDWFFVKMMAGVKSAMHPETALQLNNALMVNFICKTLGKEQQYNAEYSNFVFRNSRWATEGAQGTAKSMVGWNKKLLKL